MTIPVDPSPFLLAAGVTKVRPPEASGMISVEALGLVSDGAVSLHRLYLPGREAFFMLHLGPDGTPSTNADISRCSIRLRPPAGTNGGYGWIQARGSIGWPQFQTKDGKTL